MHWRPLRLLAISKRCSIAQAALFRLCQTATFQVTDQAQKQQEVSKSQCSHQCAKAALSQCLTPEPKILVITKIVHVAVIHAVLSSSTASQVQVAVQRNALRNANFVFVVVTCSCRCLPCSVPLMFLVIFVHSVCCGRLDREDEEGL